MNRNLQLNIKSYIKGLMLLGIIFTFAACQDKDEFTPDPITGDVEDFYEDAQGAFATETFEGFDYDINEDWSLSSQTMSLETWSFFWDGKDWDGSGYELYVSETGWYNVSKLIDPAMSASEQICIQLPVELFDGNNSDVFLILDDYDTVIPLEMDSGKMLFCASFSNMPEGTEATIVSISSLGETNYYYGTSHAIISVDTEQITIVPESKTKEQILDLLGMF